MTLSDHTSMADDSNRETDSQNPVLQTIVETSLYAEDLSAMEQFYSIVLKLQVIAREAGRHVFFLVGKGSVLLVFKPGATIQGHLLPSHGSTGPGHVAFGIEVEMIDEWREQLLSHGVSIENEQLWPRGGHSIYFRDPAGNSIELITPNVWGTPNGW